MKKKLEKKINLLLSLLIILLLLPLSLTIMLQKMKFQDLIEKTDVTQITEEAEKMEAEVLRIVAKEIPVNSSREAILAQTVIARTNLYAAKKNNTAAPEMFELEEMRQLWAEEFENFYRILEDDVAKTKGQVLLWNGDYIYAAFHAISAGETRTMAEVYENSTMPYLQKIACPKDVAAEGYIAVQYFSPEEMGDAKVVLRDESGYVQTVQQGEETLSGDAFREKYQLNSACFSIAQAGQQIRIVTKGLGHGLGLSQYTAEQMAQEGKTYQEILAYFYKDTKIVTIEDSDKSF